MKVIIAGSRSINDMKMLELGIELSGFKISEVVWGTASGVDELGKRWAQQRNVPVKEFRPEWEKYGSNHAPKKRNNDMADYADALIAIWNGHSPGMAHMIAAAILRKLPYSTFRTDRG